MEPTDKDSILDPGDASLKNTGSMMNALKNTDSQSNQTFSSMTNTPSIKSKIANRLRRHVAKTIDKQSEATEVVNILA